MLARSLCAGLVLWTAVAAPVAAADRPAAGSAVSALYHEGTVTFRVDRADVVGVRVRVFDAATDALIHDSRALRGTVVEWPVGDRNGAWRYVVDAWNAAGELVTSQSATSEGVTDIYAIDFDTVTLGTTFEGGSSPIVMGGDVQFGAPGIGFLGEDFVGSYLSLDSGSPALFLEEETAPGEGILSEDFIVDLFESGDLSVQAPIDAIAAPEILNEAGVNFASSDGGQNDLDGLETIASATVFAPSDGFLLAVAGIDFRIDHVNGTPSTVETGLNIDNDSSIPSLQDLDLQIPSGSPTGLYNSSASPVGVFPVNGGFHTVHLLASELSGNIFAFDANLAVVFLPTTYGVLERFDPTPDASPVDGADGRTSDGLTDDEIAAERAAAVAAVEARREAERATAAQRADEAKLRRGDGLP